MKPNLADGYIALFCIYYLRGVVYSAGGILSRGILAVIVVLSVYFTVIVNKKYRFSRKKRFPEVFKGLNAFLIMYLVYSLALIISGQTIINRASGAVVPNSYHLIKVFVSLMPIYAFYYFTRRGMLDEKRLRRWVPVFFVVATLCYITEHRNALAEFNAEEIQNNAGYTILMLLPTVTLFRNKPVLQYLGIAFCLVLVVLGMKRGAIGISLICVVWLLWQNLRTSGKRTKWIVLILSLLLILAGYLVFANMMAESAYFQYRIAATLEGNSSGRDRYFEFFIDSFLHKTNLLQFLFGRGANATLKIFENYAHNDWLELATNQGLLGIIIYAFYYITFFRCWKRTKATPVYEGMGVIFIMFFLMTLFSMSYAEMMIYDSSILGYSLTCRPAGIRKAKIKFLHGKNRHYQARKHQCDYRPCRDIETDCQEQTVLSGSRI